MVQLNDGQSGRVGQIFGTFALSQLMVSHHVGNACPPIIEITCHQQGGARRNLTRNVLMLLLDLAHSAGGNKPQMHHNHMHVEGRIV